MKKYIKTLTHFTILILFLSSIVQAQEMILPIHQVRAGMKGKGKTVFAGSKIEEFGVDILGVIKNETGSPKRNLIIARLSSEYFDDSGLYAGMSGSPVYVDGKVIGAIAYGWAFAKEAIAGITPIEEILAIEKAESPQSLFNSPRPITKYMSLDELFSIHENVLSSTESVTYQGRTSSPLLLPLIFEGFSSRAIEKNKGHYNRLGFSPVSGNSSEISQEDLTLPDASLQPGDMVGLQLISGDMKAAATGTVTYVDGDKVFALGHPFNNLGAVEYGMTKAQVIAMIPSYQESFKLSATGAQIGRFSQDRTTGVFGEIGIQPRMIPVNIELMKPNGAIQRVNVQVVEDKVYTPFLLNMVIASLMFSEERAIGDLSIEFRGNIFLENGMSIQLEDLFSGNFDMSIGNLANIITAVTFFLTNNEFSNVRIHKFDFKIVATEDVRIAYLEKVLLDKYDAVPGENIQLQVSMRNFRGESVSQTWPIPVPTLPPGSEFFLIVSDTQTLAQIESNQYRTQGFVPRSLAQMVRMLSNLRKNNRIYVKIVGEKPGLFLRGEEMPNLPPSMKSMFSSPRAATSSPTTLTRSTLFQAPIRVPFVFQGAAVIPVRIRQ